MSMGTKKDKGANEAKKAKSQKLPMQCAICGQKSRFKYYNVQSCESCKQFFRRIVMKQKEFHCLKFWTCDFLQGERCRGCRLDKCLRLGMDPLMVNIEMTEDLRDFIHKLEQRRRKLLDPSYCKYKVEVHIDSIKPEKGSDNPNELLILAVDSEEEQNDIAHLHFETWNTTNSKFESQSSNSTQNHTAITHLDRNSNLQMQLDLRTTQNFPVCPALHHLGSLLQIEERIRRIHLSRTELAPDYLDSYSTLGEIITRMDNLLANSEQFSLEPAKHWVRPFVLESITKNGVWGRKPVFYIRDLILCIDFARALPVFSRLSLEDQVTIVSSFTLSISRMIISFYSIGRNSETMILPNGMPIAAQFKICRFATDRTLETLSRRTYDQMVRNMQRVAPSREEFVLLLQLLFMNSATSGLSTVAQQLLKEEAEKSGKALLMLQQSKLGNQAGALRYVETLGLICDSVADTGRYRQLIAYLDAVYEQGQLERVMPKTLAPLLMQGSREMPKLPDRM